MTRSRIRRMVVRRGFPLAVGLLVVIAAGAALTDRLGLALAALAVLLGVGVVVGLDVRLRVADAQHMLRLGADRQRKILAQQQSPSGLRAELKRAADRTGEIERRLLAVIEAERLRAADRHREAAEALREVEGVARDGAARVERAVTTGVPAALRDQTRDIEALLQLFRLVEPRTRLPFSGSWAMNAQSLLHLADLVIRRRPRVVLELGGGTSTVWLGYLLEGSGARVVSLDHDEDYAARTRQSLDRHGLATTVEVRHAPLKAITIGDETFSWYAEQGWSDVAGIDLLIVDGPPKKTGSQARYPALPALLDRLAPDAWVLLDDADRPDEREIVQRWTAETDLVRFDEGISRLAALRREGRGEQGSRG